MTTTTTVIVFRLSWEMVDQGALSKYCNADPRFYSNVTQVVPNSQIPDGDWSPIEKTAGSMEEIAQQYGTLKTWADSDREFVRNVKIECATTTTTEWVQIEP